MITSDPCELSGLARRGGKGMVRVLTFHDSARISGDRTGLRIGGPFCPAVTAGMQQWPQTATVPVI
jgi:hypothetical protein